MGTHSTVQEGSLLNIDQQIALWIPKIHFVRANWRCNYQISVVYTANTFDRKNVPTIPPFSTGLSVRSMDLFQSRLLRKGFD